MNIILLAFASLDEGGNTMLEGIKIYPDGRAEKFTFSEDTGDGLLDLQAVVGGDIQMIQTNFGEGTEMVLAEAGKLADPPLLPNKRAQALVSEVGLQPGDVIVGTVALVGEPDANGNTQSVPAHVAEQFTPTAVHEAETA